MSNFAVDSNRNIAAIRTGALIGGIHGITTPVVDTPYRLMPNTDSAAKVTDNNTAIDLGALRTDIRGADISGWHLRVLTSGYEALYTIAEYDATTEIAQLDTYNGSGNISEHVARLPATFDVVYYPQMLLPLTLTFAAAANETVHIEYTAENAVTPTTRVRLITLVHGDQLILPIQEVDKLFYNFSTVPAGNFSITWGEQYVS